ncbi:hypothetical protein LCGC14_0961970 [marine sediment metagenome]|uniref:Uncharacterized protein n=1 Tax=marine sediment metagenome TaxID=412755 RepID=A0A0F9NE80_9ZZZZ
MTIALIIAGWVLCGFLAYGLTLAHFQRIYPELADRDREVDRHRAFFMAFTGPIGLITALILSRHGFMWRLPPRDGA